jgi:hypothetical protein
VLKIVSALILAIYVLGTWRYARHKFLAVPNPGNPVFYFDERRQRAFDVIREYAADKDIDGHHLRNLNDPQLRHMLKENGLNYYSNAAEDVVTLGRYEARQWDLYIHAENPDAIDGAGVRYKGIFPLRNNWFYVYRWSQVEGTGPGLD